MIELELLGIGADGETLVFTDPEGEGDAAIAMISTGSLAGGVMIKIGRAHV